MNGRGICAVICAIVLFFMCLFDLMVMDEPEIGDSEQREYRSVYEQIKMEMLIQ